MEKVLWSDKTKIKLIAINLTSWVWRKRNAEFDPKNISTVQHSGGNMFGAVFLLRLQDDVTALKGQWMEPCIIYENLLPLARILKMGHI